jgi:hypothetical protein
MTITNGKTTKDSKYLKRIKDAIEGDSAHPKNNGIKMQAHHIISAEGMKRSALGKKIEEYGYDINNIHNLVFIPCTLQGACYLGIQPHRGNHDSLIDENNYVDDSEPKTYHEYVASEVRDIEHFIKKNCAGNKEENSEKVISKLNSVSLSILATIQHQPHRAPLTKIARSFGKAGVGCSGVDSVTTHNQLRPCAVERKHLFEKKDPAKSQATGQKIEEISFILKEKFKLKPGN